MKTLLLPHFIKQLKPLLKKYSDLRESLEKELGNFSKESSQYVGKRVYKLRLANKKLGRGKSGGFRLYVLFVEQNELLVPLAIYAKSNKKNLPEPELQYHLEMTLLELSNKNRHFVD